MQQYVVISIPNYTQCMLLILAGNGTWQKRKIVIYHPHSEPYRGMPLDVYMAASQAHIFSQAQQINHVTSLFVAVDQVRTPGKISRVLN